MPRIVRNVAIYAGAILSVSFVMQGCSTATKTTTSSGGHKDEDIPTTPTTTSGSATTTTSPFIWSYHNNTKFHVPPQDWHTLRNNDACQNDGPRQSPINININHDTDETRRNLTSSLDLEYYNLNNCPLKYNYAAEYPSDTFMRNQFDVADMECRSIFTISDLVGNKLNCTLKHFHMHFNSEHTFNKRHKDGELHFVHSCDDGTSVVIGVLMEKTNDEESVNEFGEAYLNKSLEYGKKVFQPNFDEDLRTYFPFEELMSGPFAGTYYNYMGSLTTPPCTETVTWIVTAETLKVSTTMFDELAKRVVRKTSKMQGAENPSRAILDDDGNPKSNRNIQDLGARSIGRGDLLFEEIFDWGARL